MVKLLKFLAKVVPPILTIMVAIIQIVKESENSDDITTA